MMYEAGQSKRARIMYAVTCMKDRRISFEDHWQEISDYVKPRSYRWLNENWQERGNKANKKIISAAATIASRTLRSVFSSNITPRSRPWFTMDIKGPARDDYEAKLYAEDVTRTQTEALLSSNFYQEADKIYETCANFGSAAMLIEEDEEDDFRCETLPIGSFWLGIDSKRRVNQFAREVPMTVAQMLEAFGFDNLSDTNKAVVQGGAETNKKTVTVMHAIVPEASPFGRWTSYYIDPTDNDEKRFLKVGYYQEFPVIAPRWDTEGDDVWGLNSPGMLALGTIKELQVARKQRAKAHEKLVAPPTVRSEGTMRKGIDSTPGADNVIPNRGGGNVGDAARPLYQINYDMAASSAMMNDLISEIREIYYYNLFLMVSSERRSGTKAREIEELAGEKMIVLASVYEQFSQEFLDPAMKRIYNILQRRGKFPPEPESMRDGRISIEYVSVMAQAMKLVGIGNLDRALAVLGQVASVDPRAMDIMDSKAFVARYWDRLGVETSVRNSPEAQEQMSQARQAQADQAQMQQQATIQADTAKVLSDAKLDEDNALSAMIGRTLG